jgi:hypothetical protein
MLADASTYGDHFPAYRANPLAETLRAVERIASDPGFATGYDTFKSEMVCGDVPDFNTAMSALTSLAQRVRQGSHRVE